MSPGRSRLTLVLMALLVVLALRIAIVCTWHVPGGDGVQYWKLANSLRVDGTFAFATGAPPTWSRLPGYPLALKVMAWSPLPLDAHTRRATLANVLFDLATAF